MSLAPRLRPGTQIIGAITRRKKWSNCNDWPIAERANFSIGPTCYAPS